MTVAIPPGGSNRATNDAIFAIMKRLIGPESLILDFGAGAGHMCQRVGEHLASLGAEPREHLLACEIAPENFKYGRVDCHRIETDSKIPYESGRFDLIYAVEVIEHAPRPYDFFFEAFDKLKPGGHLVFTIPNFAQMQSRLKLLFTGFAEMYPPPSVKTKNAGRICGHIMPLSYPYLVYGLKRAGFEIIEFHTDRTKRSASFFAFLLYPFLKLGTGRFEKAMRQSDPEVWEETREVARMMNSWEMLTARSCIMLAQK